MEQMMRKYPVVIQTFERIIKEGFVYVDKTDLVWQLVHYANLDLSSIEESSTAQELQRALILVLTQLDVYVGNPKKHLAS